MDLLLPYVLMLTRLIAFICLNDSGLYGDLCMINHSCRPNCIKFEPRPGSRGASEVWTTCPVAKGEELTICYIVPQETCTINAQEYLFGQHGFHCDCIICRASVALNNEEYTRKVKEIESVIEELEEYVNIYSGSVFTAKEMMEVLHQSDSIIKGVQTDASGWDKVRLEARVRVLLSNGCSTYLAHLVGHKQHRATVDDGLTPVDVTRHLILSSCELYALQSKQLLGKHHPNVATTLQDVINALDVMIQHASEEDLEFVMIKIKRNIVPVIVGNQEGESNPSGPTELKQCLQQEVKRINNLYSLAKQFPEAVKIKKVAGRSYWGKLKST